MVGNKVCGGCALKIVVGITLLVLLAGGAGAATLTVDDSGGAIYTRIQDAINNASAGDTILVYSGTYYENVNVNKQLILRGVDNGGGTPIVDGRGKGDVIKIGSNSTLEGFEITNSSSSQAGIWTFSYNNVINNNTVRGNYFGIAIFSDYNTLSGNNVLNNSFDGIFLFYSINNTLIGNNILNNKNTGIFLEHSYMNTLSRNTVMNNGFGIFLHNSSNNLLYSNNLNNYNTRLGNDYNVMISNSANTWNITKTQSGNINGGSYLGGNYWANPIGTGFSQTCTNNNSDGICDSPYSLDANNIDYLPLAYNPAPIPTPNPTIEFTYVPPYGSSDNLQGKVTDVTPADYKVAVYIYVSGWWTKPSFAQPLTSINADGSWTCTVVTGGSDQYATIIKAYLVPNGYNPPQMSGGQILPSELNSYPNATAIRKTERHITFSGEDWVVKSSEIPVGPGLNYFSDSNQSVWVDNQGQLHLKIVNVGGKWYSSEVYSTKSFGYGTYKFYTASIIDQLDKNVVAGLFTWSDAPEYNHREMDIEFSKWGQGVNDNSQYVVQPWDHAGNRNRFNVSLKGNDSVHSFNWESSNITFQSSEGSSIIGSWVYTGPDIPLPGGENVHINLWLYDTNGDNFGDPPSDGKEAELIVKNFVLQAGASTLPPPVAPFDTSGDGVIQRGEAVNAVVRFFSGDPLVPRTTAVAVVVAFFSPI